LSSLFSERSRAEESLRKIANRCDFSPNILSNKFYWRLEMQPKTIFILELELESVLPDLATSSEFGYFSY
jgi:hypothetical protein